MPKEIKQTMFKDESPSVASVGRLSASVLHAALKEAISCLAKNKI